MTDLQSVSVTELAERMRSGRLSASEVMSATLEQIDALDPALNAFVRVDAERALGRARALDRRQARGEELGELHGIPVAVKDEDDVAGLPTTHGSALLAGAPPAREDSVFVARLKAAGAIIVGKTNMPEFGWQAQTENPTFGITRNPWDLSRTPGGSSGGSAVALAARLVPLATGLDGGGSIRIPAALCGLPGFKPSLGRVPFGGSEPPGWPDLTVKAPMARTTPEIAAALDVTIGPDPTDLRSLPMPEPSWLGAIDEPRVPLKVAWSPTLGYVTPDREVLEVCERAVGVLAELGAEVVEVDSVFYRDPLPAWLDMTYAYLTREITRAGGPDALSTLTPALAQQLEPAMTATADRFLAALEECHRLNVVLVRLFHEARLLVTPATAAVAPRCGHPGVVNGVETWNWVAFTYPFNMTRSPAGTVCAGLTREGLPVGLQLIGPQHGDVVVLRTMAALEAAVGLFSPPPVVAPARPG